MPMNILLVTTSTILFWLLQVSSNNDPANFWTITDKYGLPTAGLAVACWFIWNRQKKSDKDRNDLMEQFNTSQLRNNELTKDLIKAVQDGNQCKFIISK